jgi:uncharacterized membrane protein
MLFDSLFAIMLLGCTLMISGAIITGAGAVTTAINPTTPSMMAHAGIYAQFCGGIMVSGGCLVFARYRKKS